MRRAIRPATRCSTRRRGGVASPRCGRRSARHRARGRAKPADPLPSDTEIALGLHDPAGPVAPIARCASGSMYASNTTSGGRLEPALETDVRGNRMTGIVALTLLRKLIGSPGGSVGFLVAGSSWKTGAGHENAGVTPTARVVGCQKRHRAVDPPRRCAGRGERRVPGHPSANVSGEVACAQRTGLKATCPCVDHAAWQPGPAEIAPERNDRRTRPSIDHAVGFRVDQRLVLRSARSGHRAGRWSSPMNCCQLRFRAATTRSVNPLASRMTAMLVSRMPATRSRIMPTCGEMRRSTWPEAYRVRPVTAA
jgi:hypothetical protein